MKILGSHTASFASVRALAVHCHALDLSASELFFASTHVDKDEKTKAAYEEQFTSLLLSLAIALRTKFYQGYNHRATIPYVSHCGFLFNCGDLTEQSVEFSMKDVCDKIIHALSIEKDLGGEMENAATTLCGKGADGAEWELSISVRLFAEAVLNWLRDVEATAPALMDAQVANIVHVGGLRQDAGP